MIVGRHPLQHLSNADIASVLDGLARVQGSLVLTEHARTRPGGTANLDIVTGPSTRFTHGSWVDISAPPFNAPFQRVATLCEVTEPSIGGVLRTVHYRIGE